MRIINPTDSAIEVSIEGTKYVLPAEGELSGVRIEHALYWKSKLHSFLIIKEDGAEKVEVEEVEKPAPKKKK